MAATFANTALSQQPTPYQHAYKKSGQFTATSSGANTPTNVSPTSPRTVGPFASHAHHAPPIRPLKTPIYVPAALRRTEKPTRQSPPKVDSANHTPTNSIGAGGPLSLSQAAGDGTPMSPVSRIANEDWHSIYENAPLSPVAGPITKNHWQPDSSTSMCTASSCQTPFGFFNRRHHCRKCGGIFCGAHSLKRVRLNEHALFHPEGEWQRSCDRCHTQFREWEQLRSSRTNSESSASSTAAVRIDNPQAQRPENHRVGSLATSFGGNWNWSTF